MIEEITEIMDEEESSTSLHGDKNIIGITSAALRDNIIMHIPAIRAHIREQIIGHIKKKQSFCYYLEMRSFLNMGYTKVGMFVVGDGNTATDPELSKFLHTIPHVFTPNALKQFLEEVINIRGIREYNIDKPGAMPPVIGGVNPNNNTNFAETHIGRFSNQWR